MAFKNSANGLERRLGVYSEEETMDRFVFLRCIGWIIAGTLGISILGCSKPLRISEDRLAFIGVTEGATYWEAQQKLAQEGYQCFVTGAKRENFDCTRTLGFFPTCVLRVRFVADDKNFVSNLHVANPACIGTP